MTLLGTFRLTCPQGRDVAVARKGQAILAMAALAVGRAVPRARIAGQLWCDKPEARARASLRQELSQLRLALGPGREQPVRASADGLALAPDRLVTDLDLLLGDPRALGRDDLPKLAADLLDGAEFRDRGSREWLEGARRHVHALRVERLLQVALEREREGDADFAARAGGMLLEADPLDEVACRLVMRAFLAMGRASRAVQVYRDLAAALSRELDVPPAEETVALLSQVRGHGARGPGGRALT